MISRRPRRGQVFFADLEEIGRKLVLVVSADEVNDSLSPVVCLLTSTERERALPTFVTVDPPEAGLWKPTAILCHNLVTLDLWRFADEPIGSVSVETLSRVDDALRRVLSLAEQGNLAAEVPEPAGPDDTEVGE